MESVLLKVVGWYLIITSIIGIIRFKSWRKDLNAGVKNNRLMFFVFGAYELIIGLLIVTGYNVWEFSHKLIITLLGWGAVIEAIILMAFPKSWLANYFNWTTKGSLFMIWPLIGLVLGAYLLVQTGPLF